MRDEVDHVTGFSVLREAEEGREYLTILCRSDKTRTIGTLTIPVAEKGKPHKHTNDPWFYEQLGDGMLKVRPSVRWMNQKEGGPDVFHNGGEWTVKFVCADHMGLLVEELNAAYIQEVKNHWRLYPKKPS